MKNVKNKQDITTLQRKHFVDDNGKLTVVGTIALIGICIKSIEYACDWFESHINAN